MCSNPSVLGESASPFIDEGDGLTSERERERVRMLLSLVAHAVGYNDDCRRPRHCLCWTHVGGLYHIHHVRQMMAPITLLMPRGMWGVLPCLSGMGIDGAHKTVVVKCQRPQHCLGSGMTGRLQGTFQTCPVGYCPIGVQGTVLGIAVECPALLAPFVSWSSPSGCPQSVGSSRL